MQTKSEMINRIAELAKEVEQWQHEYEVLDACCELAQGKIAELKQDIEAYKRSEQEASEIIAELKAENEKLKAQLEVLEEDNKKLSSENDALYNNSLQEVKEDLVKRVWNLQTENKELAHYLACMTEQRNKANTCLQEIKAIVKNICDGCTSECDCDEDCNYFLITEALTKAEEE